eukprot:1660436-Amphidinium_carterae.1
MLGNAAQWFPQVARAVQGHTRAHPHAPPSPKDKMTAMYVSNWTELLNAWTPVSKEPHQKLRGTQIKELM